jgi:hypothetical protein
VSYRFPFIKEETPERVQKKGTRKNKKSIWI